MSNIRFAEWILSLVSAPDRAVSTAGDLAEGMATYGAVWFWSAVARTAASHVWRGVAEMSGRVARAAFVGGFLAVAAGFLWAYLSGSVFWYMAGAHIHHSVLWAIVLNMPSLITALVIGRIMARWAVDREVAACLVYIILMPALDLIVDPPQGFGVLGVVVVFLQTAALQIPALAGALWERRRRLQRWQIG